MPRMYAALWSRLVANETVTLTCHESSVTKISRALYKEKCRHRAVKDIAEQPSFGRLKLKVEDVAGKPNHKRIIATIAYSGNNL